jgi:hypothetical protein
MEDPERRPWHRDGATAMAHERPMVVVRAGKGTAPKCRAPGNISSQENIPSSLITNSSLIKTCRTLNARTTRTITTQENMSIIITIYIHMTCIRACACCYERLRLATDRVKFRFIASSSGHNISHQPFCTLFHRICLVDLEIAERILKKKKKNERTIYNDCRRPYYNSASSQKSFSHRDDLQHFSSLMQQ